MYLFNVCKASEAIPGLNYPMSVKHKLMTMDSARLKIKRLIQEDFVQMYNGLALKYVVNRRNGSKFH